MGRSTFLPAVGSPHRPWPNLQVFVLTPEKSATKPLQLINTRTFPDGSVEHTYTAATPDR